MSSLVWTTISTFCFYAYRCVSAKTDISAAKTYVSRQSTVCVIAIESLKRSGVITYRDFNIDEAKKCALPPTLDMQQFADSLQGSPSPSSSSA